MLKQVRHDDSRPAASVCSRLVRFLGPLSLLVALTTAPLAAQPQQVALAPDSEERWVPFELSPSNHIRFTLLLNGKPATAILDTGVSVSIVSRAFAPSAGIRPVASAAIDAIGGKVNVGWAGIDRLSFGGLSRSGGRVAIADLDSSAADRGMRTDALIGSDVLACCALEIDYDAMRFRLLPSGRLPFRGATAPLARDPVLGAFVTELRIGGRRVRPVMIDTGDAAELTLDRSSWAATGVRPAATTRMLAEGLGGRIEAEVTSLPDAALGALDLRDVELWIEDGANLSARQGLAGRIGSGLLRRYHVLLDPGVGRAVFAPGARSVLPPRRWTSGLVLGIDGRELSVLYVMPRSPAADAGWKSGERICAIDGAVPTKPLADMATSGAAGRSMRFGMCGGGERDLVFRRFY